MTLTRCCILFVCLGGLSVPLAHAEQSNKLTTGLSADELGKTCIHFNREGRYADAIQACRKALAINESTLGPEHPKTATSLNNLAQLYHDQGRYSDAEPLYKRALAIEEKALGPEHPDTATTLNNLAKMYHEQGRYSAAEPIYRTEEPRVGKQRRSRRWPEH